MLREKGQIANVCMLDTILNQFLKIKFKSILLNGREYFPKAAFISIINSCMVEH